MSALARTIDAKIIAAGCAPKRGSAPVREYKAFRARPRRCEGKVGPLTAHCTPAARTGAARGGCSRACWSRDIRGNL